MLLVLIMLSSAAAGKSQFSTTAHNLGALQLFCGHAVWQRYVKRRVIHNV